MESGACAACVSRIRAIVTCPAAGVQDKFDDEFWESRDVVVNALDNVKVRGRSCKSCSDLKVLVRM